MPKKRTPKPRVEAESVKIHKPRKPPIQDIKLTARQFCRARGYRWERCAGFLHDMKVNHPGDKTRPEWTQLWDAYWARPVK